MKTYATFPADKTRQNTQSARRQQRKQLEKMKITPVIGIAEAYDFRRRNCIGTLFLRGSKLRYRMQRFDTANIQGEFLGPREPYKFLSRGLRVGAVNLLSRM